MSRSVGTGQKLCVTVFSTQFPAKQAFPAYIWKISSLAGKISSHAGKVPAHAGKVPARIGKVPARIGKVPAHA
jgi:hypothetical protein